LYTWENFWYKKFRDYVTQRVFLTVLYGLIIAEDKLVINNENMERKISNI